MEKKILKLIKNLINFPSPKICKHAVMLDLLNLLEESGYKININLVDAILDSDDEKAGILINKELKNK